MTFLTVLTGAALLWSSHLCAEEDLQNIRVAMKIVVAEKDKEEKTFNYLFNMCSDKPYKHFAGKRVPFSEKTRTTENGKTEETETVSFIEVGTRIMLKANVFDDKIKLDVTLEMSDIEAMVGKEAVPRLKMYEWRFSSLHTGPEELEVFSGDELGKDRTIHLFLKAEKTGEAEKAK